MGWTATELPRRRRGPRIAAGAAAAACALLLGTALAGAEDDTLEGQGRAVGVPAAGALAGDADATAELPTEVPVTRRPTRWMPARGRRPCRRYRGRMACDGPRRTPVPEGAAAERAERLGLGTRDAATHLLLHGPRDRWLDATPGVGEEDLLWPVEGGRLWRGYGRVRGPGRGGGRRRVHEGVDIGAREGTPIRAARSGLVAYSDNEVRGYGNLILVVHADGSVAFYAHCQEAWVFAGQTVQRGQVLGTVGATGLARGAHLHFELRVAGRPRNVPRFAEQPPEP